MWLGNTQFGSYGVTEILGEDFSNAMTLKSQGERIIAIGANAE